MKPQKEYGRQMVGPNKDIIGFILIPTILKEYLYTNIFIPVWMTILIFI